MHRVTSSRGARRRWRRRPSAASSRCSIEEGQRVEKDEIIARLDDSNTRAAARPGARAARAGRGESRGRARSRSTMRGRSSSATSSRSTASVISAQAFRHGEAAFNAARADFAVRTRGVELARAGARGGAAQPGRHHRARAVRRRRHGESRAGGRDRLAAVGRRRLHAHGHRHHRRHGFARSRSRRERELHQSRAAAASRPPSSSMRIRIGRFPRK